MDNLRNEILAFGEVYKDVPELYGIYIRAGNLAAKENVTREDFERMKIQEPLREELVKYGQRLTGFTPSYNEEIPYLERELERVRQLDPAYRDEEAIVLLEQNLQQARDRDYESNVLVEPTFLNQYGEYDRGDYQDHVLAEYRRIIGFIQEVDRAQTEHDVNAVRVRFSIFKRDQMEQRYNMLPGIANKSKYVRSFRSAYRK